ncbi:MAG: DUF202 domain-containing protein [Acidimicrobiia bacterium]|nr:DUF202 domain-containing protein [Acidimicrobiia bacterium]
MEPRGPTLWVERTQLAWTRTGLAFILTGTALFRLLPPHSSFLLRVLLSASMVAVGAVAWIVGGSRRWDERHHRRIAVILPLLTVGTGVVALFAGLLAVTGS